MHLPHGTRRTILLALSLLAGCAASDAPAGGAASDARDPAAGGFGNYLAGRFALSNGDGDTAARDLLLAWAANPGDPGLTLEAFIACVNAGNPEAVRLARALPDNQIAQLLLAGTDAKAGDWQSAEQRYQAIPRQGLMPLLQPLLVAWTQQGSGRTAEALATLRPSIEAQRFRGVYPLHAAMIADLGGQTEDAAHWYDVARREAPDPGPRIALILASWEARSGHPMEAQRSLGTMARDVPDTAITMPAMIASIGTRPVNSATDGLAEAYFAFASALRSQEAGDFAMLMLRLSLDLRPDFAPARLAVSEIEGFQHHPQAALNVLRPIPNGDPLGPIIRLRRAALEDRLDREGEALKDLAALERDFPDNPQPDIMMGDLQRSKQHFPEAIAAYDRAIAHIAQPGPSDWAVFYSRGVALERTGDWPRAEADFDHALQLSPDQPLVLNYLAYSWTEKGQNLARAQEMILRAAASRPDDGAIADSLGWVLYRQGNTAEAVRVLERAVELEPEDPTINAHLGDVYWAVGRAIEARYQWRRALTLNPPKEDVAGLEAKLQTGSAPPGGESH